MGRIRNNGGPIMDQSNAVTVIEKLAEICKDGEKGYKDAAEHAKRSDLKTFFATESSERGRFARELQAVLMNLGKTPKKEPVQLRERCTGYGLIQRSASVPVTRASWNRSKKER